MARLSGGAAEGRDRRLARRAALPRRHLLHERIQPAHHRRRVVQHLDVTASPNVGFNIIKFINEETFIS